MSAKNILKSLKEMVPKNDDFDGEEEESKGVKYGLSKEDIATLETTFKLLITDNGEKVKPSEVIKMIIELGLDEQNKVIYDVMVKLEGKAFECSFEDFLEEMSYKIGNMETEKGINRTFELYDRDGSQTISLQNMREIATELGETMSTDELKAMVGQVAANGEEITKEDFLRFMSKKINGGA